jgi:uncharacterized protein YukE
MAELSGRELLREWQRLTNSALASATSAAARSELPRQLLESMQHQLEVVQEVVQRDRGWYRERAEQLAAPVDALFDLLEDTGSTLRRQAEALEAAGAALEESGALMKIQADRFERTIRTLRQPTQLARSAAGLEPRPRRRGA